MVTGHASAAMRDGTLPSAIDALVQKPCGIEQLAQALKGGQK